MDGSLTAFSPICLNSMRIVFGSLESRHQRVVVDAISEPSAEGSNLAGLVETWAGEVTV